jgi:hypothetical protein
MSDFSIMGLAVTDCEEALQIFDKRFTRVGGRAALKSRPMENLKSGRPTLSGTGHCHHCCASR